MYKYSESKKYKCKVESCMLYLNVSEMTPPFKTFSYDIML